MNHSHTHNQEHLLKRVASLENSDRKASLPPEKVIELLSLESSDDVIDLGSGSGYFTLSLARTAENVYALDMDQQMLTYLSDKAEKEEITNIKPIKGTLEQIPVKENQINKALASLVLHEVPSIPKALKDIHRVLKERGQLLCLELADEAHHHGHPRITADKLEQYLLENNFVILNQGMLTETTYFLLAEKSN